MTIEKNKSLKEFTTFRIGGSADLFCAVKSEADLNEAIVFVKEHKIPFFVLGGGSNILISDSGFRGLVIKMEMKGIEIRGERVSVAAGENWDGLVERCVGEGLYGLENLSLIPGTVGAAPVQNIGAYGSEVRSVVETVRAYGIQEDSFRNFTNEDCQFDYRSSLFKKEAGSYIITSVTFTLKKNGKVNTEYKDIKEYLKENAIENPTLTQVRDAVVTIRTRKLPDVRQVGTAGSFFKNPILSKEKVSELVAAHPGLPVYPSNDTHEKVSLAWILDKVCGYRGVSKGDVGTYKNQALVLVNNGNATAAEILSFADEIKKVVKEKVGIEIEEEVQMV